MSSIILNFEEKQLALLRERAKMLHFASLEEFFLKIAAEFLDGKEANVEAIMQFVLGKHTQGAREEIAQTQTINLTRHLDRIMQEDHDLLQKLA